MWREDQEKQTPKLNKGKKMLREEKKRRRREIKGRLKRLPGR